MSAEQTALPPSAPLWLAPHPLVLASGSRTRRLLVESAGIPVVVHKPSVNEGRIAADLVAHGKSPRDIAMALAAAKAEAVAGEIPGRLLLAADQTLEFEGTLGMKAGDPEAAREQLQRMRGKTHQLHSAAVLREGARVLKANCSTATLLMRPFSDEFLTRYLDAMGRRVCDTVGGYELEALGVQLFDRIEGDHTAILGLAMAPLLEALRDLGALLR